MVEGKTWLVLADDVEVFGMEHPLHWPRGMEVLFLGEFDCGVYYVVGTDGESANLPARLFF